MYFYYFLVNNDNIIYLFSINLCLPNSNFYTTFVQLRLNIFLEDTSSDFSEKFLVSWMKLIVWFTVLPGITSKHPLHMVTSLLGSSCV